MTVNLSERFWARVDKTDTCWLWTGCTAKGYGSVRVDGKFRGVHRLVYEALVGPIPDGLQLDHLCRVRACCNPAHLEPVTSGENTRRSPYYGKPECVNGHPYTPENTFYTVDLASSGRPYRRRRCRTCRRRQHQQWVTRSQAVA